MKTVVHVNDKVTISGGVEVYVAQLQPLLRLAGWDSYWVSVQREGDQLVIEGPEEVLNWQGSIGDFAASTLAKLIVDSPTILHLHSISDPSIVRACLDLAPVVRTMHDPRTFCPGQGKFWSADEIPCPSAMGVHCLWHAYTKRCCHRNPRRLAAAYKNANFERNEASQRYSCIIAGSHWTRHEAINAGTPANKISLIHYFTPPTELVPVPPPAGPRVAFVGRLAKSKGVHYLLRAFSRVVRELPDAKLDIHGSGVDEDEFKGLADKLELKNTVVFHGWSDRDEVDLAIEQATVVAFPSIYPEAFGISGIEAMMRSKPVVAYDVGGVSDWLDHGVTGTLVPAKEIEGLATALTELLQDLEKAMIYGQNARRIALDKFSPEQHLKKLIKVYGDSLASNGTQS